MKRLFFIAAALLSIVSSCLREDAEKMNEPADLGIYASVEPLTDTKTYLDEGYVRWASADMITLFDGNPSASVYKVSDEYAGKTSAVFKYVRKAGTDRTGMTGTSVAVYPHNEEVELLNAGSGAFKVSGIELPAVQIYAEASFADESFPMAAVRTSGSSDAYAFRNVCGGLKIQLTGDCAVREIEVKGNNGELLAGPADITVYTDGKNPMFSMLQGASASVTLDCGEKGIRLAKSKTTDFIIALPPVQFTKGLDVVVRDVLGRELHLKTTRFNEVMRSSLLTMPSASFNVLPAGQGVVYNVRKDRYSATYADIDITFAAGCETAFHYTMKMDDSNAGGNLGPGRDYYEGSSSSRKALARYLCSYGYSSTPSDSGTICDASRVEFNLTPDTEYVVAYCSKDIYGELSTAYFSEPFRTKPLQMDAPQNNESDIHLEFQDLTRTSLKFNFTYDPVNTAVVRFVCIKNGDMNLTKAYDDVPVPSVDASQEELRSFFAAMNKSLFMNVWPKSKSGTDTYTLTGLDPGVEIAYAYLAEDMNGVWSEIKIAKTVMKEDKPGPDPEMSIIPVWNASSRTWTVTFRMVKDCSRFKYTLNSDDNMYLRRLGTDDMRAYEFYDHWYNFVYGYGIESQADGVTHTSVPDKDHVALAVSWGENAEGREVISELEYVILTKDGQQKMISSYYPSYTEK